MTRFERSLRIPGPTTLTRAGTGALEVERGEAVATAQVALVGSRAAAAVPA